MILLAGPSGCGNTFENHRIKEIYNKYGTTNTLQCVTTHNIKSNTSFGGLDVIPPVKATLIFKQSKVHKLGDIYTSQTGPSHASSKCCIFDNIN